MSEVSGAETIYYQDMLRETGYIPLNFSLQAADIDPLFAQFRELSELAWAPDGSGQALVEAMHYRIETRPKDADYFMVHRRAGEVNPFSPDRSAGTDNKDMAHVGPRSFDHARQHLREQGLSMPKVMRDFLASCEELHEAVKTSVRPVYRALGMEALMLAPNPKDDIHMVRVLRYLGTTASHKAALHFDRSTATFAAWESSSGLVGAPGNNALGHAALTADDLEELTQKANASPITHVSGEGKFFLAAGYNRLPQSVHEQNGYLPLLAHGVINKTSGEERDAVVVFMNPHLHVKDYVVPTPVETGLDDVYRSVAAAPERQLSAA